MLMHALTFTLLPFNCYEKLCSMWKYELLVGNFAPININFSNDSKTYSGQLVGEQAINSRPIFPRCP